eukprot:CAMPEP_0201719136 /NCGR_PEP_ID=MMETSP0593-20130828/4426_1 /ASSEMBLY_ACC=CAM_ASM_000672 /TAXON_ID=267983 /ORGANISM="Skeletonema japonicum, Strain CCMP2506" /LENGTH=267 /DNA_ID=CAMNT_0048209527 /DNA_START=132 /DNA_END=935 /DNA_ORIENTATION=-
MIKIGAIAHEILCYASIFGLPYSFQYFGWTGVFVYTATVSTATVVLDFKRSSTAGENVRRIAEAYKVPPLAVHCLMACNMISANVLVVWLLRYFDAIDVALLPPNLDCSTAVWLICTLGLYFFVSEVTFTAGHVLLHRTAIGRRIHKLHHLCFRPSWSTNLLFHPLDLAVEFGGPFSFMPLMHVYMIGDPLAFRVAIIFLYIWYAACHSENLGLSHCSHHSSFGSLVLTIYGRYEWFERLTSANKKMSEVGRESGYGGKLHTHSKEE